MIRLSTLFIRVLISDPYWLIHIFYQFILWDNLSAQHRDWKEPQTGWKYNTALLDNLWYRRWCSRPDSPGIFHIVAKCAVRRTSWTWYKKSTLTLCCVPPFWGLIVDWALANISNFSLAKIGECVPASNLLRCMKKLGLVNGGCNLGKLQMCAWSGKIWGFPKPAIPCQCLDRKLILRTTIYCGQA